MNEFLLQLQEIFTNPLAAIFLIGNIILLECVLSIDNAAVLATMVMDLPQEKRKKALRYGIIGAYLFRGLALLLASFIIKFWWLKPIGGLYLIYITYKFFKSKTTESTEDDQLNKNENWLYKATVGTLGVFWSTVALVELMDIAFSIDNIFAVVAFSKNTVLICFGVFIGILAMRFVAQTFVKLLEKYKFLETAAFVVIGLLGLKLLSSIASHYIPSLHWLDSENVDWIMSGITILVFLIPILTSWVFKWPKTSK